MRILPICACVFAADGCEACSRFACCTRVEAPITLHAPQALAAVLPPSVSVNQSCSVRNKGCYAIQCQPTPPFFACKSSSASEIRSIFARCSPGKVQTRREFRTEPTASRPTARLWKHRENGCSVLLCLHLLLRIVHMSTDQLLVTERHPAVYRRRSVVLAHHACPP